MDRHSRVDIGSWLHIDPVYRGPVLISWINSYFFPLSSRFSVHLSHRGLRFLSYLDVKSTLGEWCTVTPLYSYPAHSDETSVISDHILKDSQVKHNTRMQQMYSRNVYQHDNPLKKWLKAVLWSGKNKQYLWLLYEIWRVFVVVVVLF